MSLSLCSIANKNVTLPAKGLTQKRKGKERGFTDIYIKLRQAFEISRLVQIPW